MKFQIGNSHDNPFVKALMDAGIIPENCRRCVIDIPANGAITVHLEVFGDGDKLNVQPILDAVMEVGVKIQHPKADEFVPRHPRRCQFVGRGGTEDLEHECDLPEGHDGVHKSSFGGFQGDLH